jgi:hypothetical protein
MINLVLNDRRSGDTGPKDPEAGDGGEAGFEERAAC